MTEAEKKKLEDLMELLKKPMGALTIEDADKLLAEAAELQIKRTKISARFDLLAARLVAKGLDLVALIKSEEDNLLNRLSIFIEAHRNLFEKPRKRKTPYGSYGLENGKPSTKIEDEALVIKFSDDHKLSLYKTSNVIDVKAVAAELETGKVPGAKRIEGKEKIVIAVEKKLLEKAERETRERLSPPAQGSPAPIATL